MGRFTSEEFLDGLIDFTRTADRVDLTSKWKFVPRQPFVPVQRGEGLFVWDPTRPPQRVKPKRRLLGFELAR
jgi:hypothetical protein